MNSRVLGFSGVYMVVELFVTVCILMPFYVLSYIYKYSHTIIYTPEKPSILESMYWHVSMCGNTWQYMLAYENT